MRDPPDTSMEADSDPRRVAWETLIAVESGAFADAALALRLSGSRLAVRDRSLAVLLVYGTLAWQGLLDHVIASYVRLPRGRVLDVPIRVLLRLGFFQLLRLSRVPAFAAVDTAVELARGFRDGAATGLVNAVLRRFLREGKRIRLPSRSVDLAAHLSVALSHPRWLVDLWLEELGPVETEALLTANNAAAPTVLRANRRKGSRQALLESLAADGVGARPGAYSADAVVLESPAPLTALPGWGEGLFVPQGEASQLVSPLLGVQAGQRALDACAAPGGKATHLAEILGTGGMVVAVDRNARGLRYLGDTAARLGLDNISIVRADAGRLPFAVDRRFDAVLLDAPCSGLGTLRQHPEIRWRRTARSVDGLADLQYRLLVSASHFVGHRGVIVYATCTIAARENDRVVERFLAAHGAFVLDDPRPWLPESARPLVGEDGFLRTFPHRHGLDGFFAARLRRRPEHG